MQQELTPIRDRAAALSAIPGRVSELLEDGARRAQSKASETMAEVKAHMGLT